MELNAFCSKLLSWLHISWTLTPILPRVCGAFSFFFFLIVALVVKNLPVNVGNIRDKRDVDFIPASRRSSGGGCGNPLQYSCLENPMDRGAWQTTVHGVTKSQTWLEQLSIHRIKLIITTSFRYTIYSHIHFQKCFIFPNWNPFHNSPFHPTHFYFLTITILFHVCMNLL